jgi:undecaprenyl diphosphate synthase
VKLKFIGARHQLQPSLAEKIAAAESKTRDNTGLRLTIAVAYGGRWDLVEAARKLAASVAAGELELNAIDDRRLAMQLAPGETPDADLLIRTGGEQRISNFLLWHLAYAELWFCDTLWPDFGTQQFDEALEFYAKRQRRYGHTGEQIEAVS